jgi:hypothetical protein
MRAFRKRLTYGNVVATLALFVALGGAGYAAAEGPVVGGPEPLRLVRGTVETWTAQTHNPRILAGNGAFLIRRFGIGDVNVTLLKSFATRPSVLVSAEAHRSGFVTTAVVHNSSIHFKCWHENQGGQLVPADMTFSFVAIGGA